MYVNMNKQCLWTSCVSLNATVALHLLNRFHSCFADVIVGNFSVQDSQASALTFLWDFSYVTQFPLVTCSSEALITHTRRSEKSNQFMNVLHRPKVNNSLRIVSGAPHKRTRKWIVFVDIVFAPFRRPCSDEAKVWERSECAEFPQSINVQSKAIHINIPSGASRSDDKWASRHTP